MKLIKPLIYPKCFEDESPIGYLLRLAELNLYGSYRWLITGKTKPSISLSEIYELLCQNPWTGFTQPHAFSDLNGLTYRYLQTPKVKVCQQCLKEGKHWNIHAHAVLSPICVRHRCWNTDTCLSCNKSYSWHRGDLQHCSCKSPRGSETASPSQNAIELSTFIEKQNDNAIACRLDANEFTYKSRCDLFLLFSLYVGQKGRAGGFPRFNSVDDIKDCWGKVGDLLFGDMRYFNDFLKILHAKDSNAFKNFYRSFQEFDQPSLSEHRTAMINFITQDLKTPISRQHRSLYSDRPKVDIWLPLQTVSRQYQIPKSTLNQLIENGKLKHQMKVFEKRAQTLIFIESPKKFQGIIDQYITYKEAVEILGVTKAQMKTIIAHGFIDDVCKPENNHLKWLISKAGIKKFKDQLHSTYEERDCQIIKTSEALSFYSAGFDELLPSLIQAILAGQITVISKTTDMYLRDIALDKEEFISWRDQKIKVSDHMSIPELAKRFRIKQESMYQIVNAGLIEAKDCGKNRLNRLVSESEIEKFKKKYALLSRIADVLQRSPVSLKAIIDWRGLEPIQGNGEKLRQTIYKREDLLKVDQVHWTITTDGDWWYDRNYPEAEAA